MAVTFKLPPKYSELRDLCHIGVGYKFDGNEVMLRSDVEDWLDLQHAKYECVQKTENDGWLNRIHLCLTIVDDTIALQFKLQWI